MNRKKSFALLALALLLFWGGTACNGDPGLTEADVAASVEAAIAATNAAQPATATAVTDLAAAETTAPVATWTPIPAVNVDTPTPANTLPPPPTNTPLPTVPPPTPTETPTVPTNTPVPTATAVPPTNTPAPPPPTAPPAEPTVPPNPVFGGNILVNGSFEDGWYNLNGIPELQLPNSWIFEFDQGATGFGSEAWDVYVRPETRVLPAVQLPPAEQPLFIRDGQYTVKMFKGFGAISYRVLQEIALPAGSYRFSVNAYPDLVVGYENGNKVFADDPAAGEIRFITPDGGTGWIYPTFGTWNTLTHTFSLSEAQTVRVGIGVRGRYAISNNGWFFDEWSLQRIEN